MRQGEPMKRQIALTVLVALLTIAPRTGEAQTEQTIMDMTLRAAPGNQGQCFLLAAGGKLDVSFQSADADFDPMVPPVTLGLGPYRTSPAGHGSPPEIQNVPVTPALTTVSLPVSSGLYCYGLYLSLPLNTPVAVGPAQTAQWRYVALKMVLTPQ